MVDRANLPEWYRERRRQIDAEFAAGVPGQLETTLSPSGRYSLEITRYETGPLETAARNWAYTRGRVLRGVERGCIATVDRNFRSFPHSWSERHTNGHDYLICGEDYQGQTVIELDTGKRVDYVPESAEWGHGFCWVAHYPSPDGKLLFVDGCIWAAPYELVLYDFSEPLQLPYRELKRWPVWEVHGFASDGTFAFEYIQEFRKADGVGLDQLSAEERDVLTDEPDYTAVIGERKVRVTWYPDRPEETALV